MNTRSLLTALIFLMIFQPSFSGNQEPYADLWLRGTMEEKRLFVSGIAIGLSLMRNYSRASIHESGRDSGVIDSAYTEEYRAYIDRIYKELSYLENGFKEENVIKAMDVLYKKEKNKDFSFQQMYIIALKEIRRLKKEGEGR